MGPALALLDIITWTASLTGIVAALMVATNVSPRVTGWGFVVFTFSSVLWILGALIDDQEPLAIQNVVLFGINLWGIYRYLLRKRKPE
jgi:hypothetical protein